MKFQELLFPFIENPMEQCRVLSAPLSWLYAVALCPVCDAIVRTERLYVHKFEHLRTMCVAFCVVFRFFHCWLSL